MNLRSVITSCFLFAALCYHAQQALGTWEDHLSYRTVTHVAARGDQAYCASGQGLFSFNLNSGALTRMSKVSGLSDVGVNRLAIDQLGRLVVGYKNGNLDIVEGEQTYNLSDIKRSNLIGNKQINDIYIYEDEAWLSCGFGIVIVDLSALEIKDTYFIGNQGANIEVYSTYVGPESVVVTTESGILRANRASNLADFSNWQSMTTGLSNPNGAYYDLVELDGTLFTFNVELESSVFLYDGNEWSAIEATVGDNTQSLASNDSELLITNRRFVELRDGQGSFIRNEWSFPHDDFVTFNGGALDENGGIYIADEDFGLVTIVEDSFGQVFPDSPYKDVVRKAQANNRSLTLAHGELSGTFDNLFVKDGFSSYTEGAWYRPQGAAILDTIRDLVDVIGDPLDPNKLYFASHFGGLLSYNKSNQSMSAFSILAGNSNIDFSTLNPDRIQTSTLAFDINNNLWITNSYTADGWKIKKSNGDWVAMGCPGELSPSTLYGDMVITETGQTWTVLPRSNGLVVLQHDNEVITTTDHQCKKLGTSAGDGGLPTNSVLSIAEDLDGEIWVGTSEGPVVNYSPQSVFSNSPSDFQSILVERDGNVERLLGSESITAIAVDGANRKWIGTLTGGVFLLSEDGTEEIAHFTEENSPLFSNSIRDITIDGISGTVYFVTNGGVLGYVGDAVDGIIDNECYDVYPNPVRPSYSGPITIDGLKVDSEVKITDLAGNIVFQTISNGGRATWQGTDFSGDKVGTGVYFALISDPEGESTCISKILFVN